MNRKGRDVHGRAEFCTKKWCAAKIAPMFQSPEQPRPATIFISSGCFENKNRLQRDGRLPSQKVQHLSGPLLNSFRRAKQDAASQLSVDATVVTPDKNIHLGRIGRVRKRLPVGPHLAGGESSRSQAGTRFAKGIAK